jgi:transposase
MNLSDLDRLIAMLPVDSRAIVQVIIRFFEGQLAERDRLIAELEVRIRELEAQLNQHSGNSSRPPSSDGANQRAKAKEGKQKGKKRSPGGQTGHQGRTLKMVPSQEATIENHYPTACGTCGGNLRGQASLGYDRRQVFDIPPLKIEVTEHRAHVMQCPCCAHRTRGVFPMEATNNAVYGPNIRATVTYLMAYQMLPYERTAQLLSDLFGVDLSQGTLDNMLSDAESGLETFVDQVRLCLQQAPVAGFDETVVRSENAQHYAHVARTEQHTLLHLGRRDYQTMDEMNVLPHFKGLAVHDRYSNYFGYDCEHGLCNAHILRDLQGAIDRSHTWEEGHWAERLQSLLRSMNKAVKRARSQGKLAFSHSHCAQYRQRFRYWVEQGLEQHPEVPPPQAGAPPPKQSKTRNLLLALDRYADEVLRFLYDFTVPFDNNGAERDIRMLKVKMKISGFFHNTTTGNRFLRIRSFVSTACKQGWSAFYALCQLFSPRVDDFVLKLVTV